MKITSTFSMLCTFSIVLTTIVLLAAASAVSPKLSEFREACSYLETTQTFNEEYVHSFFKEWMVQYEKNYSTSNEMIKRREIFKKNLLDIQKFNSEGNNTYRRGINQFTDENEEDKMDCEEYVTDELLASEKRVSFNISDEKYLSYSNFFDWRDRGAVTSVRNQGECGSCWAFAATGAIESLIYINSGGEGDLKHLSPQELIDCDRLSNGCKGGRTENAFVFASKGNLGLGITTEMEYPYQGKRQQCSLFIRDKSAVYIDGYTLLSTTEFSVRIAVTHQPVVARLRIGDPFKQYTGGIFKGPCGSKEVHAVLIVGFGESHDGVKYWIVKNSWGENWGEKGYIRMLRETKTHTTLGLCNILSRPIYPTHVSY